MNPEKRAQEIVQQKLKHYAEHRLTNLSDLVMKHLLDLYLPAKAKELQVASREEQVQALLEKKRETASPKTTPPASPPPDEEAKEVPPPTFVQGQHQIRIVFFNALKLRLEEASLADDWARVVEEFASYDVLVFSEIRGAEHLYFKRAHRFRDQLNLRAGSDVWTAASSNPSGPGTLEVHLLLYKSPISVREMHTLVELSDEGGSTAMDHAPLVVQLEDARFRRAPRIHLTSVHLPPKTGKTAAGKRLDARNRQARLLFREYPRLARTTFKAAFTEAGMKEAAPTAHILGGDFNADADELHDLGATYEAGWDVLTGNWPTSSSGKSYDHIVVARASKSYFVFQADFLPLAQYAKFSKGIQGISDHAPLSLTVKEIL
jgi:hypothetical protein